MGGMVFNCFVAVGFPEAGVACTYHVLMCYTGVCAGHQWLHHTLQNTYQHFQTHAARAGSATIVESIGRLFVEGGICKPVKVAVEGTTTIHRQRIEIICSSKCGGMPAHADYPKQASWVQGASESCAIATARGRRVANA